MNLYLYDANSYQLEMLIWIRIILIWIRINLICQRWYVKIEEAISNGYGSVFSLCANTRPVTVWRRREPALVVDGLFKNTYRTAAAANLSTTIGRNRPAIRIT